MKPKILFVMTLTKWPDVWPKATRDRSPSCIVMLYRRVQPKSIIFCLPRLATLVTRPWTTGHVYSYGKMFCIDR